MAIRKERNRHLTDDLRPELEVAIRAHKSFSQIKRGLGIPRSTIKREIMNHREESTRTFYGRRFNPCTHRDGCQAYGMCARPDCTRNCASCDLRCRRDSCPRFEEEACPRLAGAPYVCNGCPNEGKCRLRKFHYLHKVAHRRYRDTLASARQGINATQGELRAINEILVPALNRGQSVHHAMVSSPDSFGVCERTVYKYVNAGVLSVRRHNLPMAPPCPFSHAKPRQMRQATRQVQAVRGKSVPTGHREKRTSPTYRRPCPLTSAIDKLYFSRPLHFGRNFDTVSNGKKKEKFRMRRKSE